MTIHEVIQFIRSKDLLKNWSTGQIALEISRSVYENAFAIEISDTGEILSVCIGKWISPEEVYITALGGKGCLFKMLKHLKDKFPECKYISCERSGKNKRFKVIRMLQLTQD